MQERPILFSGEMVNAIMAGRKTQTRRVIRDYPWTRHPYYFCGLRNGLGYPASEGVTWAGFTCEGYHSPCYVKCPYGQPGDLLWVKEACAIGFSDDHDLACDYHADGKRNTFIVCEINEKYSIKYINDDRRPAMFMPRWASRITLEVNDVRVERLQEISETDAMAEGVIAWHGTKDGTVYQPEFKMLWDKINTKRGYSWDSNPWVWVIEFRRKI